MNEILFLSAPLKERIWGSNYFKDVLNKTKSNELIGEMWSCSGLANDSSIILNDKFKGQYLSDVFKNNKHLFANSTLSNFPILIKIISTNDILSVQVHPDDEYAKKHENSFGKTEGWLILDKKEDSSIIIGHNAKNKEELLKYVENDDYDSLLNERNINRGEFYPIPAKTIHALGKNLLIFEVQQSSDITYRFYDYHRKDKKGNERELHIAKAIDVTSFEKYSQKICNAFEKDYSNVWNNQYFNVDSIKINGIYDFFNNDHNYYVVSVVEGSVYVNDKKLSLGDSFIVTSLCESITFKGQGIVVITKSLI